MPNSPQNSPHILISAHPFAQQDLAPLTLLSEAGFRIRRHGLGRRAGPGDLVPLLGCISALLAGTEPLPASLLAEGPNLRVISRIGVGLDNLDLRACESLGISVLSTPDAATDAVAEYTLGLMIALSRGIVASHEALRSGRWQRGFGLELAGARLGLLGFGRIGQAVARLAGQAFRMRVFAHDPHQSPACYREAGVENVSLAELLAGSDILSLHLPLTPATRRILDAAALARLPAQSYLINTSRGGLVDEAALYEALHRGRLAGAALDVYEQEPYSGPLIHCPNVILTAHMAANSAAARIRMETHAAQNLVDFFTG